MADSTLIKFCGITRLQDAEAAVEAGAWAIGMIFWPGSQRACDPGVARTIAGRLRREVEIAGVFVNPPLDEVTALAELVPLSLVQLHGDEGPSFCAEVGRRTGARVIKAGQVRDAADIQDMERFRTDFHLLDTRSEELRGGTGQTFDWELVQRRMTGVPLILSGGLTADNVGAAIAAAEPHAVDVASGIESAPGLKDPDKLRAFAAAVQATHTLVE